MADATYETMLQQVLLLSWDDREKLSLALWESCHPPNPMSEEEFDAMLERRIREIDEGRAKLIPHDQAWRMILGEE